MYNEFTYWTIFAMLVALFVLAIATLNLISGIVLGGAVLYHLSLFDARKL